MSAAIVSPARWLLVFLGERLRSVATTVAACGAMTAVGQLALGALIRATVWGVRRG